MTLTLAGIITKPDTLIPGSNSEAFYAALARNEEVEFRLGWHVLKNMDTDKGIATVKRRDEDETQFFSEGIWAGLPRGLLGITELNGRLSKVLLNQIAQELPNVIKEIGTKLKHCSEQLETLGQPRSTPAEQVYYLMQVSQAFQTLVKAAVDGTYNDPFFEDPETDRGYEQRIRAVIQNLNRDFAKVINDRGHYRQIASGTVPWTADKEAEPNQPIVITRDAFVDHIQELMRRTRGRELPCTFSPLIATILFKEQCCPWGSILEDHVKEVFEATKKSLECLCSHIADSTAGPRLFAEIVQPALGNLLQSMEQKAKELLLPHQESHPITYNQDFLEAFQKSRDDRRRDAVVASLTKHLVITADNCKSTGLTINKHVNFAGLVESLANRSEPDLDRFAASEALDCMEAYYKARVPTSSTVRSHDPDFPHQTNSPHR